MAYIYNRSITIDHTKVSGTQTDFPVGFIGTYSYLKTISNGGHVNNTSGFDIIFTSDSLGLTILDFEIDYYDPTTGQVVFWIRIPSLSSTVDTVIYMFYGNPSISTSQANPTGTWNSNYMGVYHLREASNPYLDSTSNARNSTASIGGGGYPTQANGTFGKAQLFGGTNGIIAPHGLGGQAAFTQSCWLKTTDTNPAYRVTVDCRGGSGNHGQAIGFKGGKAFNYNDTGGSGAEIDDPGSISDGNWHFIVGVTDVTSFILYVDGIAVGSPGRGNNTGGGGTDGELGNSYSDDAPAVCTLDEVHNLGVKSSAGWILTEWNNGHDPATFYAIGAEQGGAGVLNALFSDQLSWQDSLFIFGGNPNFTLGLGDILPAWADSPRFVGVIDKVLSDTINNLTDAVSRLVGIPIQAFDSNQTNLLDALVTSYLGVIRETPSDQLSWADAVSLILANVRINITVADTINLLADAFRSTAALNLVFTGDTLVFSDNLLLKYNHLMKLAESINLLFDAAKLDYKSFPAFADSINLMADGVMISMNTQLSVNAADQLSWSDSVVTSASGQYNGNLTRIRRYLNDLN